jgi:beta-glucosidase
VFINADSGEEYIDLEKSKGDRYDLNAWHSGNELVEAVLDQNKSVVVVINAPGPINLPFLDRIKGLIFCGFGGAESGNAITSVLFGDYNPSGHLPFVWGELENYPSIIDIFSSPEYYEYTEGVFVGQRYFDKYNKKYIFPFGFGMSYAKFEWKKEILLTMKSDGLYVSFSISNIGTIDGEVVPMVFLEFPDNIETEEGYPKKIFKGFDKKLVSPNFGEYFEIFIDNHSLEYYNIKQKKFVRPQEGMYTVYVGNNAEDIQLQGSIRVIP